MKSLLSIMILFASMCSASLHGRGCGSCCYGDKGNLAVGYTFREDCISYELKDFADTSVAQDFDKLRIHQITARGYYICDNIYFRGHASGGWIFGGNTTRKEFIEEIDLAEIYGNADDCNVFDLSGGVGYQFDCGCSGFKFIPIFGYSWSRQDIETSHLKLSLDIITNLPLEISIPDLKECYRLDWYGPWIGIDFLYADYCGWDLFAGFEYHWADICGNYQRSSVVFEEVDFTRLSRDEHGCGQGFVGNAGILFDLCCNWTGFVMGSYQAWNLNHGCGKDEDGDLLEMRKLDWKSWSVSVGIACNY
ncbi:MAG: hypothetical protein AAGG81_05240 [Chlamydiota bacterium]